MSQSPTVVAVDWSGRKTDDGGTWVATVVDGELVGLHPSSRAGVVDYLVETAAEGPLVAGLDFSFSFPRWVTELLGPPPELWRVVAERGEEWLADCSPPFWGRTGSKKLAEVELFRTTELDLKATGLHPKSTFQIGGAGAVGTGSIRGMPHLARLAGEGFSIWPFTAGDPTVVEMYPRLLTGPVIKSSAAARAEYLATHYRALSKSMRRLAAFTEDAFDAAVSALVMWDHRDELLALEPHGDPEGEVWRPIA